MTNFFGPGSPYLGHPLLTEDRTRREVDQVLSWCGNTPTDVLDLGCGFGRHSIELARRGFAVTGVDPAAALIDRARQQAEDEQLAIEFVESGGEEFVRDDSFDLAICLFTTLGQLPSEKADPHIDSVLTNLRRSLRPGATLVVEVPERERVVAALVESEELGPTQVTRRYNPATHVLSERFETPGGVFDLAYVVLSQEDLVAALEAANFSVAMIHDQALDPPPNTFMTAVAS